jgi:hypothetical protein
MSAETIDVTEHPSAPDRALWDRDPPRDYPSATLRFDTPRVRALG